MDSSKPRLSITHKLRTVSTQPHIKQSSYHTYGINNYLEHLQHVNLVNERINETNDPIIQDITYPLYDSDTFPFLLIRRYFVFPRVFIKILGCVLLPKYRMLKIRYACGCGFGSLLTLYTYKYMRICKNYYFISRKRVINHPRAHPLLNCILAVRCKVYFT